MPTRRPPPMHYRVEDSPSHQNPGDLQQIHADMKTDPVFRKLSKHTICFHIWKVEQDRIEAVSKSDYAIFKDDCTYIVYGACTPQMHLNQDTITREVKASAGLERFIHFWLGQKTSPLKSGNVAFKIMELDTYLGHIATQYRETQGNESARFLSYFKKGITILSSSAENSDSNCKLFQITGSQWPVCTEMDSVNWDHFSCDYTMILKTLRYIFVWFGRSSSPAERRNGLNAAKTLGKDYKIPDLIVVDDGYEQSMNESAKMDWNFYLPLKLRLVNQTVPIEKPPRPPLKLYKCNYHKGKYRIEEVKTHAPQQSDFSDSDRAYIVDGCTFGVWMWLGKSVGSQEVVEAMRNARGFVKKKKYAYSTPVIRVIEGHEPLEFMHLFSLWKSANDSGTKVAKFLGKLDSLTLLQRPKMAAESQLIDDGSGEKHIYRWTEDKFVEIPFDKNLVFFSTDSYILNYTITLSETNQIQGNRSRCNTVLYFWSGKKVPLEVYANCEATVNNCYSALGKNATMIKLNEGFESPHFLQIFGGKLIIFKQRNTSTASRSNMPTNFVLKVVGDCSYNSKAYQVSTLESTCPRDCFIIKASNIWVWCGQGSTGDAREAAKSIGSSLGEYTLVLESKEPEEFWNSVDKEFEGLGIQENYKDESEERCETKETSRASLYLINEKQGNILRKEVIAFTQADLIPENIYLLDVGSMIFIWVGEFSTSDEAIRCWFMAKNFLSTYPAQRNEDSAVALVHQGYEPNIFVGFFDGWEDHFWDDYISYDKMRKYSESKTLNSNKNDNNNVATDFDKHHKYPLSVLQQEAELLPSGVDITKKELHLTHDDFVELFQMKYSEFISLPSWKRQELKKKYKLF